MTKTIQTKNIVWKEGDKYVGLCLDFGVSSFGKTKKAALSNLQEAVELYLEDDKAMKDRAHVGRPEYIESSIRCA